MGDPDQEEEGGAGRGGAAEEEERHRAALQTQPGGLGGPGPSGSTQTEAADRGRTAGAPHRAGGVEGIRLLSWSSLRSDAGA